jgi:hypothetical protein
MDATTPVNAQAAATEPSTTALAATHTTPDAQAADGTEAISLEEARKLRSESANMRKRLRAYEEADAQAREAALSEAQKIEKRATEAEQRVKIYQQQLITAHVKLAAQAKGIIDPDLAALAIQSGLEFGDDGMPSNIDQALDELVKTKTYLLKQSETATPAAPARQQNPGIPINNPGRRAIQSPAGRPGRPPTLDEVFGSG